MGAPCDVEEWLLDTEEGHMASRQDRISHELQDLSKPITCLSLGCCEIKQNESEICGSLLRMRPTDISVGFGRYSEDIRYSFLLGENWKHG